MPEVPVTHADAPASGWKLASQRFVFSAVVVLVGVGVTLAAAYLQYSAALSEARERFAAWSEERRQQLSTRIDAHTEALYGLRSLFDSSEFVSPQEFDRFTSDSRKRHQDIRSLDFLRRIAHADRERFEELCRAYIDSRFAISDYRDGQLVPAAVRPEYVPLVYTQPQNDHSSIGLDTAPDANNISAMHTANRRRSTSALIIPQPDEHGHVRRWVHVYLPVFARSPAVSSLSVPLEPAGYVRVRFVLDDMVDDMMRQAQAEGVEISVPEFAAAAAADPEDGSTFWTGTGWNDPLEWQAEVAVADRTLLLRARTTARYAGQPRLASTLPLLITGLTLTLLGAIAAYQLSRSRLRSQRLAAELLVEIRERRNSEQRTAQSEARYRVLVENSPDAIMLYKNSQIIFVNRAALRLFGAHSENQLLGKSVFEFVHPDSYDVARQRIEQMNAEQKVLPPLEERLMRVDGTTVEVEVLTVPFVSDGQLTTQVTARDITQRRREEQERTALEGALRQSQRLEAIGTLAGGIAHDFNNILSSIVGNIQLLLQDLPESHPAWRSVNEIRSATHRARDLVKRLMSFGRQQEAPRTPIDVAPLIEEVQQLLRPALPAGVALRSTVPPDTPAVLADATQLHQILVNLCTNAWQSMNSGQGTIDVAVSTLSADEARRQSQTELQGAERYVCIEVRDNGSGMPPEILDRIFEPFFTTKPTGEGSGLGLAVVHGIVRSHKGAICVTSREGVGTDFRIYLPASESHAQAATQVQRSASRGANQRILYIDDEEPLVFLVRRILERSGYRCTGETDPRQAVAAVRRDPAAFDLIITDMNMPGMSGIDVAREMLALRSDLSIVITTGYVRSTDVALARSLGVRDLILKPDTIEDLAGIVGQYLQQTVET